MSREEALKRLREELLARRERLYRKLGQQLEEMSGEREVGDVGDAAISGATSEIDSQLADFETRELRLIERALELMRTGRYGICENCGKKIPIARLKVVPYSPYCTKCQSEIERESSESTSYQPSWAKAYEFEGQLREQSFSPSDLEPDI